MVPGSSQPRIFPAECSKYAFLMLVLTFYCTYIFYIELVNFKTWAKISSQVVLRRSFQSLCRDIVLFQWQGSPSLVNAKKRHSGCTAAVIWNEMLHQNVPWYCIGISSIVDIREANGFEASSMLQMKDNLSYSWRSLREWT